MTQTFTNTQRTQAFKKFLTKQHEVVVDRTEVAGNMHSFLMCGATKPGPRNAAQIFVNYETSQMCVQIYHASGLMVHGGFRAIQNPAHLDKVLREFAIIH